MIFKKFSELRGTHAEFSPSKISWLNYDDDKFIEVMINNDRKTLGTELHAFAKSKIILAVKFKSKKAIHNEMVFYLYSKYIDDFDGKIPRTESDIQRGWELINKLEYIPDPVWDCLTQYINDAIAYRMTPEQELVYSPKFYGFADTISFDDNTLRIHDLKTGDIPAHIEQLEIYAALFCLQYEKKPGDIKMELRIYQGLDVLIEEPTAEVIAPIMDRIVHLNKLALKART